MLLVVCCEALRPLGRLLFCIRILRAMVACLLIGHGAAYSQGAAESAAASPPAVASSAPVVLPRTIPFKQDSSPASNDASPSLAAIALVVLCGLAGSAWWAWRKRVPAGGAGGAGKGSRWWGVMPSQKNLLHHGSTRLSPRHSVHEIEWRGRRLLIGCADQTMTLLSERAVAGSTEEAATPGHPAPASAEDKR